MPGQDAAHPAGRRRGGRRPLALTVAATALVGGVWLLQRYPGEDWWLGALLTYAPQVQWLVPPAVALVVALAARRTLLSAVNATVLVVALFGLAGFEVNRPVAPTPGQPTMRVATWNVYGYTRDRETVRNRILSWDCDIVCLQESRSDALADLLPDYESAHAADLRIYVRGTIRRHEAIRTDPYRPRYMLLVEAETDAGPVTVVNIHVPRRAQRVRTPREIGPLARYLETSVRVRDSKFGHLMALLPPDGPMLIVGDMNTPPTSRYRRRLREHLTDAFDAVGLGFGHSFLWRRKLALLRIDYVWTGGGARPLRCWTERAAPSDHRPVLAEIEPPAREPVAGAAN